MKRIWIPQFAVSCMLLWALFPGNPYGYYILLRWVCCAVFAYIACQASASKEREWAWVLGVTAMIYNPIVPVHLTREIWSVINVVTISIAVASIFVIKPIDVKHGAGQPITDGALQSSGVAKNNT
jgi:hypothetical protein